MVNGLLCKSKIEIIPIEIQQLIIKHRCALVIQDAWWIFYHSKKCKLEKWQNVKIILKSEGWRARNISSQILEMLI